MISLQIIIFVVKRLYPGDQELLNVQSRVEEFKESIRDSRDVTPPGVENSLLYKICTMLIFNRDIRTGFPCSHF